MTARTMTASEWALLLALSLLWGGSFFANEIALADLPPVTVALGRVGLGALALGLLARARGKRFPAEAATWGALLVMGALNNAIPFSLIVWGQTRLEGGLAAILNATTPLFAVVLAHVVGEERLRAGRVAGVALGVAGVAVLVGPAALAGLGREGLAQAAVLAASLSYACASLWGRRLRGLPLDVAAAGMLAGGALILAPLAFALESPLAAVRAAGPVSLGAVAALALACTAAAYLIYFRLLRTAGPTNLMLVTLLIPPSAMALGAAFLGERPGPEAFAAMGLIFAGLALVDGRIARWLARRRRRAAAPGTTGAARDG